MPISYDERRKRREELRKSLPPALQPHIALRNVEAVSYLSPKAQEVLLDALTKGRIRISIALDYLNEHPQATSEEILQAHSSLDKAFPMPPTFPETSNEGIVDPDAVRQMAALIQSCFADMPRVSAEALAASDTMSDLIAVQAAHQQLFQSPHGRTDFIMIAFYKLLQKDLSRLNQIISDNVSLQQSILSSGMEWTK